MPRTLILTMGYASVKNVAEDIASVVGNSTIDVEPTLYLFNANKFDRLIVSVPFVPPLLNNYLLVYNYFQGEKYFYTTVDGKPIVQGMNEHLVRNIKYIPNSQFSAENLKSVDLDVDIPVFHGVNVDIVKKAEQLVPKLRQKLDLDFPDAVKIGVVTGMTKRKNVDLFVETTKYLNEKMPDIAKNVHFFVISHADFQKLEVPANVHFIARFGYQSREKIFAFYGAMDYIFVPSGCEGFGLPVLESMAMGTPVIHMAIPPFTEYTSWQWNFLFKDDDVMEYYDKDHGQIWKIHRFKPETGALAIATAVMATDREERSKRLKELAKKYDIKFLYKRFLEDFE
ncbi:putative glycosyltransferase [Metallosphaera rod-shaped virus 1]|uniref:Putative glycosyltransferase n=1 Tax=Metallosphaera rod-shaped virus 1 TaxID=2730618 RepID=A0A6M3VWW6_9VIRU|nr:putative glycosyltransferase [Metallosphaera rod-shaped virus 1]QJF12358.1 putative glycosyltransferase [Metallosphaera rod-shaped virus 1]